MMNVTSGIQPASIIGSIAGSASAGSSAAAPTSSQFLDVVNNALNSVSSLQAQASDAEQGVAAGTPGVTLGKALVGSDRAEVAWNATVAVRNEVVSAYQSIMNMQF